MYHFYNEPLLDDRLPEMIRYVSDQLPGCISRIFTNGDRLTLDMADALVDAGAFDFVVTDHPPNKPGKLRERMRPILDKYPSKFYVQGPDDMCLNNRGGSIEIVCSPSLGRCTMVYEELKIDYRGNVLLCTNDYHRTQVFGNIMEMGLKDIWKQPKYAEIRRKLRKGQPVLQICKDCSVFKECDG